MPMYRRNGGEGDYPEFGAIFMSNSSTRQECLQRQHFGLPYPSLDFVKCIRAGMILFLYEYDKKQLHGVFRAVSDGRQDIVPDAYRSSGKLFPAQVQISVVWKCCPLLECDFRRAIRENYYTPQKFKFGLSKQQVQRLLWMFNLRRIGPPKPPPKKRWSRYSGTTSLEIDSGEADQARNVSSFGNALLPAAGITISHIPTAPKPHDPVTSQLQPDTHDACVLGNATPSADRQGGESKHVDISLDLGDYIPLSSPDCCDIEVDVKAEIPVKGLYSDHPDKRESVFSRVKLCLQSAAQENQINSRRVNHYVSNVTEAELLPEVVQEEYEKAFVTEESATEILEKLEACHDSWMQMGKRSCTWENRNASISRRTSVFSRLVFASKSNKQEQKVSVFSRLNFESQIYCNDISSASSGISMEDASSGSNKRKDDVCTENQDNAPSIDSRINVHMLDEGYAVTDDPPRRGEIHEETSFQNFERPRKMLKGEAEATDGDCKIEDEARSSKGYMTMLAGPSVAEPKPLKTYSRRNKCPPLASNYGEKTTSQK